MRVCAARADLQFDLKRAMAGSRAVNKRHRRDALGPHRRHEPSEIISASAAMSQAKPLRFQRPKNHCIIIRKQLILDGI
jgi:hypothetical protein